MATVIDEVSIAEAESIGGGAGGLAAPERVLEDGRVRGSRRERHDMDPLPSQVQQPTGGLRDRLGADEDRRGVAQQPGTQPLAEARRGPALEGLGELPGREIQERHHRRQARRDRHGVARRVIHGARRPAPFRPPRRPDRGTAQDERVDRQRRLAEQPGRRQQAPADDLEVFEPRRRVILVRGEQERERLAGARVGVEAAQQAVEIRRGPWGAGRLLQRSDVHDHPHAGRQVVGRALAERPGGGLRATQRPRCRPRLRPVRHFARRRRPTQPTSSSSRSCTTTTSASTTIRRDILLWPTRRSRKVIGTSRMRAPARLAR